MGDATVKRGLGALTVGALIALPLLFAVGSLALGAYAISPLEVCQIILARITGQGAGVDPMAANLVWEVRMPRVLAAAMRTRGLAPKVIVEYERTAYISRLGNVRITFDRNIAASAPVGLFLEPRVPLTPVLPAGQHVLEVKYDEFLPDPVAQVLELGHLRRTAFSKYYLSRLVLSEPLAERAMQYEF